MSPSSSRPSSNHNPVGGFFTNLFRRVTFSQGTNQDGAGGNGMRRSRQSFTGGASDRSVSPTASESSIMTDNDFRYLGKRSFMPSFSQTNLC
jgi:hypothetical protein